MRYKRLGRPRKYKEGRCVYCLVDLPKNERCLMSCKPCGQKEDEALEKV